jgi:hypothetical protein
VVQRSKRSKNIGSKPIKKKEGSPSKKCREEGTLNTPKIDKHIIEWELTPLKGQEGKS